MTSLSPYLFFDGNCAEAMRFYETTLSGTLQLMTHRDAPPGQAPPGNEDRIMHAHLAFDGGVLMASDTMAGEAYAGMKNVWLSLTYDTTAEARSIFGALSEGGAVIMAFEKTFWAEGFGMVTDRFGASWMVSVRGEESGSENQ